MQCREHGSPAHDSRCSVLPSCSSVFWDTLTSCPSQATLPRSVALVCPRQQVAAPSPPSTRLLSFSSLTPGATLQTRLPRKMSFMAWPPALQQATLQGAQAASCLLNPRAGSRVSFLPWSGHLKHSTPPWERRLLPSHFQGRDVHQTSQKNKSSHVILK